MKSNILRLLAMGLLAGPMQANATQVSWLISGELSVADGEFSPTYSSGELFSFVLHFDTSTPVNNTGPCGTGSIGTVCRHNGSPTEYFSDVVINGDSLGSFHSTDASGNLIIVRNNASITEIGDPGSTTVDGYTFGGTKTYGGGDFTTFTVIFRGPEDLGLVTDGRVLPADPLAELLSLRFHLFEVCDGGTNPDGTTNCDYGFMQGQVTSVSRVPEPGTLALLGLGLAGLGFTRRRKA